MKPTVLILAGFFACGLPTVPATGMERNYDYNAVNPEERALMELYFGKEQLVEAATRYPKPISQVAENVTVVTAEEIQAMHAHTVAEVLERVPGVFVQFYGRDELSSPSGLYIQGSDYEHVLVLVDGIRWNNVGSDYAETNSIPVHIIDRIEVIKGAASSAWGSALGGVVNIITKETGKTHRPHGTAVLAIGEHDTEHYHGELAGGVEDLGYYLYAGRRESDGILNDRFFDGKSLLGKLSYDFSHRTRLSGECGYSQPENRYFANPDEDRSAVADERFLFYSVGLDTSFTDTFHLFIQLYGRDHRLTNIGETFFTHAVSGQITAKGEIKGVNSRLAWEKGPQVLVLGAEYLEREITDRDELSGYEAASHEEEISALYLNDTIRIGQFTLTPGVRYDRLSIADDETSPSLGLTYQLSEATLLRTAVSRGFRKPPVVLKEGDPLFHQVNPGLESETIWTFQAGVETTAIPYLWLKATGFRHEADHVWIEDPVSAAWVNNGEVKRTGLEVAIRTVPVYNLSLGANYTYVRFDPDRADDGDQYKVNLLLEYNDRKGLLAQLSGHYVQWSDYLFSPPEYHGKFDAMIWDFVVDKTLFLREAFGADVFFKVHNLFNGAQYHDELFPNAPRWVEGGLQLHF